MATFNGTDNADSWDGGNDNDSAHGNGGNDSLAGWSGDDVLDGDDGNDSLYGGAGSDTLHGGAGDDYLMGFDFLSGSTDGVDTLDGGAGNDILVIAGQTSLQNGATFIGGADFDELRVTSLNPLGFELVDLTAVSLNIGSDIERISTVNALVRLTRTQFLSFSQSVGNFQFTDSGTFDLSGGRWTPGPNSGLLRFAGGDDIVRIDGGEAHGGEGNDQITITGSVDGGGGDDSVFVDMSKLSAGDTFKGGSGTDWLYLTDALQYPEVTIGGAQFAGDFEKIEANFVNVVMSGATFANLTYLHASVATFTSGVNIVMGVNGGLGFDIQNVILADATNSVDLSHITVGGYGVTGGAGADTITGTDGFDGLFGNGGNDVLHGGGGGDDLDGGAGADWVDGGSGDDRLIIAEGETVTAGDRYTGGTGADVLLIRGSSTTLSTVDLSVATLDGDIETLDTEGNVTLRMKTAQLGNFQSGSSLAIQLVDGGKLDLSGRDFQFIGLTLSDFGSQVLLSGGTNNGASVTGGAGIDKIVATDGMDVLSGGGGDDDIWGAKGDDDLHGGTGKDQLIGGGGADTIHGGDDADALYAGDVVIGSNIYDLGLEHDQLFGDAGNDTLVFGYGDNADGGDGVDQLWLTLESAPSGSTINLTNPAAANTVGGGTIINIEEVAVIRGSAFADNITVGQQTLIGAAVAGGGGDDRLTGTIGTVYFTGGAGNDVLTGSTLSDTLLGEAGNDRIDPGLGADTIDGGDGADTILFSAVQTGTPNPSIGSIDGGADDDTLDLRAIWPVTVGSISSGLGIYVGSQGYTVTGIEHILLGSHDDTLILPDGRADTLEIRAGDGNDHFSGSGAYRLFGEGGDDSFFVSGTFGAPVHGLVDGGAGTDTLQTNIGFTVDLAAGFANAYSATYDVAGIENVTATTNGYASTVLGDDAKNVFTVSPDLDTGAAGVTFDGRGGDDMLSGSAGKDILIGGAGDDTLDGKGAADALYGGTGSDTYYVDRQDDLVFENIGEGTDTVISTASYYLYANTEILRLAAGAGDIFGVGNEQANSIYGNEGANLLLAGAGDDTVHGGAGGDQIYGQDGVDRLSGEAGIDYLIGGEGNDFLYGGDDEDGLYGEAGDDALYGGDDFKTDIMVGGAGDDFLHADSGQGDYDLLDGGSGNDSYYVDTYADVTYEAADGGTDTVYASTVAGSGYYLYGNVENLVLAGDTFYGVGNELANKLTGSAQANWLLGGAGNDMLDGKEGNDVLFGQDGTDTFVFGHGTGGDTIADFTPGTDRIDLSAFGFASFAQLQAAMSENGGSTAIQLGDGDFIVLQNVANASLHQGDFILSGGSSGSIQAEQFAAREAADPLSGHDWRAGLIHQFDNPHMAVSGF